jgi:hypothetical protein
MEPEDSMANRSLQLVRFSEDDAHKIADQFGWAYFPAFLENLNVAADFYVSENCHLPSLATPSDQRKYLERIRKASAQLLELLNGTPYLATQVSLVQAYKETDPVFGVFLQGLRAELETLSSLCQSTIAAVPKKSKYRPKWTMWLTLLHLAHTYRMGSEKQTAGIADWDGIPGSFLTFVWVFLQHADPAKLEQWTTNQGKMRAGFRKAIERQWPTDSEGNLILLGRPTSDDTQSRLVKDLTEKDPG